MEFNLHGHREEIIDPRDKAILELIEWVLNTQPSKEEIELARRAVDEAYPDDE